MITNQVLISVMYKEFLKHINKTHNTFKVDEEYEHTVLRNGNSMALYTDFQILMRKETQIK